MTRRTFAASAAAAGLFARSAAAATNNMYIKLEYVMLRNGSQPERANAFFPKHYVPAAERAGAATVGMFNAVIAPESPFFLILTAYPTFDAIEAARLKLRADADYKKAADEYYAGAEPPYVRVESSILRTFDAFPSVKAPEGGSSHIFELRTYESNNFATLRKKIGMFKDGEAGIFQRLGMAPVFFGETIVGRNQPSLTYMVSFENLAAREQLWAKFGADPEWKKLRATPGLADSEIVSNISNAILRPAPNSHIR